MLLAHVAHLFTQELMYIYMCPLTPENPKGETEAVHPPPRSATTSLHNKFQGKIHGVQSHRKIIIVSMTTIPYT
jgi:hypothetical protein